MEWRSGGDGEVRWKLSLLGWNGQLCIMRWSCGMRWKMYLLRWRGRVEWLSEVEDMPVLVEWGGGLEVYVSGGGLMGLSAKVGWKVFLSE